MTTSLKGQRECLEVEADEPGEVKQQQGWLWPAAVATGVQMLWPPVGTRSWHAALPGPGKCRAAGLDAAQAGGMRRLASLLRKATSISAVGGGPRSLIT